ncbi:MAG: ergothioneine biosynthesis protein EgtB [Bacteroidota bacterium]
MLIDNQEKTDLLKLFCEVRRETEDFTRLLKIEDYIPQPVIFASPAKWHLAHTTWFFENFILKTFYSGYKEFDEDFAFLFNSYYKQAGKMLFRADRGNMTRPSVDEVYAYRAYVDRHIEELLKESFLPDLEELIVLGLNHEQQHQELLKTDVKYLLGHNPIFPSILEDNLVQSNGELPSWKSINEGVYEIGYAQNVESNSDFCFDNEQGRHKVYIHDFEIRNELVTNAEYIEFMEDGGYERPELWLDEGWTWCEENSIKSPLYWHKKKDSWWHFTFSGFCQLPLNEILCHVSYYEAEAFARWKGYRLPTEFEWEVAADSISWGKRWEWTNSAYLPYPKYKIAEGAIGEYNGKFMINQMTLRGASCATSKNHSRKTYRNFFHPHYQWQFSGIRLVK